MFMADIYGDNILFTDGKYRQIWYKVIGGLIGGVQTHDPAFFFYVWQTMCFSFPTYAE
jgi:hypothetical protein